MLTALPLRITPDGRLDRQDPLDAVLGMIRVMAGTTRTTWPHAPWFGLFELFTEAAERQKQDHEALKDSLNTALAKLGISGYTVHAVTTGSIDGSGRRSFQLTIHDPAGQALFGKVGAP
jgi:hypothetical protein